MSRKVSISKTAERKLDQLFLYLIETWSVKVKTDFIKKLDKSIEIIKEFPESFPESKVQKGLRKCIITSHTSLYYRFNSRVIIIVTIFDNRQDPDRLDKEL